MERKGVIRLLGKKIETIIKNFWKCTVWVLVVFVLGIFVLFLLFFGNIDEIPFYDSRG